MTDELVQIAEGFWNLRGSLKMAGLFDTGTQMSLVRSQTGGFLLLDSYALKGHLRDEIFQLTDGGRAVKAVLNLHPFHTLHVRAIQRTFPDARLYGTRRHVARDPDLRWEPICTEDPQLAEIFGADLRFSVPRGVEFVPKNEHLHFSSVLAFHDRSSTLHVDDTLSYVPVPLVGGVRFHPALSKVLERRAGAADEFRQWLTELTERCKGVRHLCTAHMHRLPPVSSEKPLIEQVERAVKQVEPIVARHQARFG